MRAVACALAIHHRRRLPPQTTPCVACALANHHDVHGPSPPPQMTPCVRVACALAIHRHVHAPPPPDDTVRAVACALAIHDALEARDVADVISCGVSTGRVVCTDVSFQRSEYTAVGAAVIFAARLSQVTFFR